MSKRAKFITGTILILLGMGAWWVLCWVLDRDPSRPYGQYLPLLIPAWYVCCWVNAINEWDRRPVLLFGRYHSTIGPGLVFLEPLIWTTLEDVSLQAEVITVMVSNVQTKDNVGVAIDAALTFKVTDVRAAVVSVDDVWSAVEARAIAAINDVGATTDLDHFLEHRDRFGADVAAKLRERVAGWGVEILAVELTKFGINDKAIEEAIAMRARASKEAAAELVRAEMQQTIAKALNDAAATYDDSGRWLKGMEVLVELCRSATNNTVLIPTELQTAIAAFARQPR